MYATTISSSIALGIIFFILIFKWKILKQLLQDDTVNPDVKNKSFSLSRILLFFWTIIIVFSICYIGIIDDNIVKISSGVLVLVGIVAGTSIAGRVIDTNQISDPNIKTRHQDGESQGWLIDILSDSNGISVSRFQIVVFNLIYGLVFVSLVISQHVFYNFPNETLTLLGISSGTYAGIKVPENK